MPKLASSGQSPGAGKIFLDHVGWMAPDMERAAAVFERLGFPLTPYSVHGDRDPVTGTLKPVGTANRLAMLEQGYLEILAPIDGHQTPLVQHLRNAISHHTGVHLLAFSVNDAEETAREIAAREVTLLPAVHLRRTIEGEDGQDAEVAFTVVRAAFEQFPEARVRAVDLDPAELPAKLAAHLCAELLADDARVEVGYAAGVRRGIGFVPAPPPAGVPLRLGEGDLVVITGGARGLGAACALALAKRHRCALALVGRSPLPGDEPEDLAAAAEAPAPRKALLARGARTPAAIEAEVAKVLAAREIRATLAGIAAAGARASYHAVDVRDRAAFGALLDELRAKHGRIAGAIHAAGVLEDRLVRDKTVESFRRVFDTKVEGALALEEKLPDDVGFVAFFGSVAGAFGNRGQADYAAANDALDKIARRQRRRLPGRVVSIDWGPWAGAGMVGPELARAYEAKGIGLIPPDEGVERLLAELGSIAEPQVVLVNGEADAFA